MRERSLRLSGADEKALQDLGVLVGWVVLLLLPLIALVGPPLLVGYGLYRAGRGVGWRRRSPSKCKKCDAPLRSGMCATCGATYF